ncbi:hypothetical protein HMPREF3038_01094 [Akkermansia sp. KLE1797]|nr:hypothetical protein HMPREF3038_01094 [Akkermansia sp. KLE1797]
MVVCSGSRRAPATEYWPVEEAASSAAVFWSACADMAPDKTAAAKKTGEIFINK